MCICIAPQAKSYFLAVQLLWPLLVTLSIIHWVLIFGAYEEVDLSKIGNAADSVHFFADEWQERPIERIWVVPQAEGCPDEYAFTRTWHGTQGFRYTTNSGAEANQSPIPAISKSVFKDETSFCISRSEQQLTDSTCPDGQVPCSTVKPTICVSEAEKKTKCPITNLLIVSRQDYSSAQYPGFSVSDAPSGLEWLLLYKRDPDSLPLSKLQLTEQEPCSLDNTFKSDQNSIPF